MFITMSLTHFAYKMNTRLKKEGFQNFYRYLPCWHIDEKKIQPTNANTQKPLWLKEKLGLLEIDCDKSHL